MATIESNFESICINPNDDLVLYKKEIVRSRIEKFLYAICSLDTDDLPTPLSRIEELYNCLVTGEDIPTFTPLSRAEKFVMAMLGAYDVELLPTPISRSETLMKKIATGDNNLDDVDNLQSRYEFLLAYIIKAGGFNGGNPDDSRDFYYKLTSLTSGLTTIYDTYDMPVKNAVLRGQTLVNLVGECRYNISTVEKPIVWAQKRLFLTNVKTNTRYTLKAKMIEKVKGSFGPRVQVFFGDTSLGEINNTTSSSDTLIFTSPSVLSSQPHLRLITTGSTAEQTDVDFEILLLEGEFPVRCDVPYFDHMTSVKMPVLTTTNRINVFIENKEFSRSFYNGESAVKASHDYMDGYICDVEPNTTYSLYFKDGEPDTNKIAHVSFWNENTYISGWKTNPITFTTPANCNKLRFAYDRRATNINPLFIPSNIVLNIGTGVVYDESFKSNILTCNEEVTLRGIGNTKDELNLVTGELTQRIGEIVLDGSEDWQIREFNTTNTECAIFTINIYDKLENWTYKCDKFNYTGIDVIKANNIEGIYTGGKSYSFFINISKTKASTVEEFKNWLSNNNVTVQYLLIESVKTVDLSTLDQDGKETKLNTFDDITHVITSSEGLVPTGDIDIARPIQFVDYSLDNGLTTLYNTIEYPVKSAVLRGSTLKNINDYNIAAVNGVSINDGVITVNADSVYREVFIKALELKPSTKYLVRYEIIENTLDGQYELNSPVTSYNDLFGKQLAVSAGYIGEETMILTTRSDVTTVLYTFRSYISSKVTSGYIKYRFMAIEYQDGMENWDIPYFTGMQSVKMPVLTTTGKNLFKSLEWESGSISSATGAESNHNQYIRTKNYIDIQPNATYTATGYMEYFMFYDSDKNFISGTKGSTSKKSITFTTPSNAKYLKLRYFLSSIPTLEAMLNTENMLELGEQSTGEYEPHKSNILTCNEEVELRGIGDIKDELNLLTGELTQRVGSITIDDSYSWRLNTGMNGEQETHLVFQSNYIFNDYKYDASNSNMTNDRFSLVGFGGNANKAGEWLTIGSNGLLYVKINKNKLDTHDIDGFKKWLLQNPIIIQYELTTESITTVDLSTLDRNEDVLLILENGEYINTENGDYIKVGIKGGKTKISTFDDITHVTVSSEGLVPTGEITVATKNATDVADASVMSLRMDDILNSQETLEGSSNTQSDDIDVTMLGATDIYEQLL